MEFYLLFAANSGLLLYRAFLSKKAVERLLLVSWFLFFLFMLGVHPWVAKSWPGLGVLELAALTTSFLWLATFSIFERIEKRNRRGGAYLLQNGKAALFEIVLACRTFSQIKQGALIAIERKDPLAHWIRSGVPLDAKIRKETIYSVFTPPGALHDGGMIIRGERIAACGVVFPLSKRMDLPTELGTRHRAALGISESSDALAITISEETGKISLADNGSLFYDVKLERLSEMLENALRNRLVKIKKKKKNQEIPAATLSQTG